MTQGAILERWRLVLGEPAQSAMPLSGRQALEMDQVLDFLYRREAGQDEYQGTGSTGSGPCFPRKRPRCWSATPWTGIRCRNC